MSRSGGAVVDNLTPVNYSRWAKADAGVLAGTGSAEMLHIGDSVTWGSNASGNPPGPGGGSYPSQLQALLNAYVMPAVIGSSVPPIWGTLDTRWAPANWASNTFYGVGGYQGVPASADMTFTPGVNCDTFDVFYVQSPGFGGFNLVIDGGAPTTVACSGVASIGKATIVGAASAAHVLHMNTVTGAVVIILAVNPRLSTDRKVRISNWGRIGSTATDWLMTSASSPSVASLALIAALAPDLVTINLGGINDGFFGLTQASYLAALDTIISTCLQTSDVLLISEPQSTTANIAAFQVGATAAMRSLAGKYKVGMVDIFSDWQPPSKFTTLGYYFDTTHPSSIGYEAMAVSIMRALRKIS